jgi:putative transposase
VLKAWYRGRIERAIKTLVYSTCHTVPGTTYANIFQRSKVRIPEKVAVCTLAQLEEIITRFIVDVYHIRCHRTLNSAPVLVFQESVARHGMKPLPDPRKLAVVLSLLYFRKAQPKGLLFEGHWYSSPQLMVYLTLPGVSKIVSVKVDPNDLTRIWYFDTSINDHVECRIQKSMRERIQGVILSVHKMARAIQRSNPELLAGEAGLVKSYALIRRSLEDRVRGRDGLTNKTRAMRMLAKLRKKAAAMFEDAPALDAAGEDEMADDLFGPEDATPDEDVVDPAHGAGNAPAQESAGNEAAPATPAKAPAKARAPRTKAAAPKQANNQPAPPPQIEQVDDMDDLERAMNANLFINGSQENDNA